MPIFRFGYIIKIELIKNNLQQQPASSKFLLYRYYYILDGRVSLKKMF